MLPARIPTKQLTDLCRRVGVSLDAGIDVRRIWQRETERAGWLQRAPFERVSCGVNRGESLHDSICSTGDFFPPLVRDMVQVGEATGHVDRIFLQLADHYDRQLALRRAFLAGIAWPMIQLGAAVAIIGLLIWIMGMISEMSQKKVDILGFGLVGTRGVLIYGTIVCGIAILVLLLVRAAARGWFWIAPLQMLLLRLPVLGKSLRTLALARMAWTLSLTTNTSMDNKDALRLALKSTQNAAYNGQAAGITTSIAQGNEIHEALRRAGGYPVDFLDALEVGEQSGNLSESMQKLSQNYEDQARAALKILTVLAGFLVWGMVAAFIVFLIFRIASFYIGILNNAAQGIF